MEQRNKSLQGGVKGRRALHYENTSLLKGKKIYLDLHGYKRASLIESGLRERGAAVEDFFTRDIKYLVTSRNLSEQDKYSSSPRTPSSSVLCNVNTNRKSSHPAQSPFSTNSPDTPKATPITVGRVLRDQHLQQHSRSRNIVAAAKMKSTGSTDVLQLAKNWSIKIIHVEDIVKYFTKHPVGAEVRADHDHHKLSSPGAEVRKLKLPFLKCEDMSRLYKPLICEVKKWPQLNLDCGPDECPFDIPQKQRRESGVKAKAEKSDKKRPGYCECCNMRFDDFALHVKGDQHTAYANNSDNFESLDAMYNTYNIPTLDQFVAVHTKRNPDHSTLHEKGSLPAKYSLLCYDDTGISTSTVDVETISEGKQVIHQCLNSSSHEIPADTSSLVVPVKNSSPKQANSNSDDLTPSAKRCRRSQSSCSPTEDNPKQTECVTPPRPSPLKNSIVASESLKSPLRSPSSGSKPSPMRSPMSGSRFGDHLQLSQSPKQCVVLLHDITKSPTNVIVPSPDRPTSSLVASVKNSSPNQANSNSEDLTPSAKRRRRSQSRCSPTEDNPVQTECVARPSPLKNFSIDILKSPLRSPSSSSKPSPMRSPTSVSRLGDHLQHSQSPKQCVVLLHDITKSPVYVKAPSPDTPTNSTNRVIVRSVSVSPEQKKIGRDTLMGSPVKEEMSYTPSNIHTITADACPKHLYLSRDILLVSSQTTPQKEYY